MLSMIYFSLAVTLYTNQKCLKLLNTGSKQIQCCKINSVSSHASVERKTPTALSSTVWLWLRMSLCQWNVIHTQAQTHLHISGQMEWNSKRKNISVSLAYDLVARGWGLQMTVQAVWDGSYVGQPAHVCFWVKPHCPRCCLSKRGQRGRGLFVSCIAGAKPNINTHTK